MKPLTSFSLKEFRERKFNIWDCSTCDRDGHGSNHYECKDICEKIKRYGSRCWRPRGVVLVFDEVAE